MPPAGAPVLMASFYHTSDDDDWWLRNLPRTGRAGKEFRDHLECVDFVLQNKNRAECPVQQVAHLRQVFCDAFQKNERCFGIPSPTPKFIAIVNLSGYRAILYSERAALVRLLCMVGPEASQRVLTNVERVITFANQNNCSVLCCFSLPWQVGVHSVHWECRSIERKADGTVRDGAMCFSYTNEDCRVVAPTCEVDCVDPVVRAAQIEAMRRHFFAGNLDIEVDNAVVDGGERAQKLQSIVAALQADRGRLLADISSLKTDQLEAMKEAERRADERVGKVAAAAMVAEKTTNAKVEEIEGHLQTIREQNAALEKKNASLVREKASQDLMFGSTKQALENRARLAEASCKAATEKLNSTLKNAARERDTQQRTHTKQTEDLERRVQEHVVRLRGAERRLENQVQATARLDTVCDQLRTEKQALLFETNAVSSKTQKGRAARVGLLCALAVASRKHTLLKNRVESTDAAREELVQMLASAEGAAQTAEEAAEALRSEVVKLEKKLAEKPVPSSEPAAPEPVPVQRTWIADAESKFPTGKPPASWVAEREVSHHEVNTEPVQDPKELLDLRAEVGQLNAEKEAWVVLEHELRGTITQTEIRAQHAEQMLQSQHPSSPMGPPGVANHASTGDTHVKNQVCTNVYSTNVLVPPQNGGANSWAGQAVDLGVDASSNDVCVEAVVGQAQLAMRALVDMARGGQQHKSAAENMWSELSALKRFSNVADSWNSTCGGYYAEMIPMQAQQWVPQPQMAMQQPVANGNGFSRGRRGAGAR